nr:MAG TPA: hypothetical protein [Caudoviricetes sp.]
MKSERSAKCSPSTASCAARDRCRSPSRRVASVSK